MELLKAGRIMVLLDKSHIWVEDLSVEVLVKLAKEEED